MNPNQTNINCCHIGTILWVRLTYWNTGHRLGKLQNKGPWVGGSYSEAISCL